MQKNKSIKIAKTLVDITIRKHKEKKLGKENMSTFIRNNIPIGIKVNEYNSILHLYNKYLAKEGYEIKKDISKFDIINYKVEEYFVSISSIRHNKK